MSKGATFVVKFRRRREGKSNYHKRIDMLKSRKPRLVVRPSNKHIRVQVIDYTDDGDKVLASAISQDLLKMGWTQNTSNMPSAYLTGLLCGKRAVEAKAGEVILDVGMFPPIKGSKLYAALKGAIDAGIQIKYNEAILPPEDRITGKHIEEYSKKKITPEFNKVKDKILKPKE